MLANINMCGPNILFFLKKSTNSREILICARKYQLVQERKQVYNRQKCTTKSILALANTHINHKLYNIK